MDIYDVENECFGVGEFTPEQINKCYYLAKFKNTSIWHCVWLTYEQAQESNRFKPFIRRVSADDYEADEHQFQVAVPELILTVAV